MCPFGHAPPIWQYGTASSKGTYGIETATGASYRVTVLIGWTDPGPPRGCGACAPANISSRCTAPNMQSSALPSRPLTRCRSPLMDSSRGNRRRTQRASRCQAGSCSNAGFKARILLSRSTTPVPAGKEPAPHHREQHPYEFLSSLNAKYPLIQLQGRGFVTNHQ